MDERLKKALEFSNFQKTFYVKRETLREKLEARLLYGFSGGLFKIDQSLLNFVQMMIDQGRVDGVPIIDANGNPILISDVVKFKDEIFGRYFEATLDYFNEYEKIKKTRSVEKLINYE